MSETESIATGPATPKKSSVVKEAEVKLKEMSRKAKERKTTQTASRRVAQKQGSPNLRLVFIGGFGIGVLGILYLMLRRGQEEKLVFVPKEREATPVKEERSDGSSSLPPQSETRFEMNSF